MKEQYYIRTPGFVGNALTWWRAGGKGYTTDIREAGKFSKDEADRIHKNRKTDIPYLCEEIDGNTKAHKLIIDAQYV